mgnify:CR=1 FL=1
MRNWNSFKPGRSGGDFPVFSVPMRNWNKEVLPWSKPACEFLAYLWGIETIIPAVFEEGLHEFLAYLWGIETQVLVFFLQGFALVFSVPMRNWNAKSRYCWEWMSLVFSVPMRNWNRPGKHAALLTYWVFSVPMRNWNAVGAGGLLVVFKFLAYLWGIETIHRLSCWANSGTRF